MLWMDEQARLTQEARLQIASPEEVYRELQRIPQEARERTFLRGDDKIELALLERNEPLINLGLACFGTNKEVFKALYKHGLGEPHDGADAKYRRGLGVGCLSNVSIPSVHFVRDFPRELLIGVAEIHEIIANGDNAEIEALLCNPSLSSKILEELYQHAGAFALIPEEYWCQLVYVSRKNERIGTEEDWVDSPDMDHYGIHKAIFRLLEIAPLEKHWLRTLYDLLNHLDFQHVANPESIDNVLARWAKLDDTGEGYFTSLPLKDEFRCLVASLYGYTYSNNKPVMHGSPTDPDVARRCAYYGNAKLSEKEMRAGYEREEDVFVFAAMNNTSVVLDNARRKTFEEEMLGGDLTRRYLRSFDLAKKRWPRIESSLSRDEVTPSSNDARIEGLQTAVKGIERQLTAIGQKLHNSQQLLIGTAIGLAILLYFKH